MFRWAWTSSRPPAVTWRWGPEGAPGATTSTWPCCPPSYGSCRNSCLSYRNTSENAWNLFINNDNFLVAMLQVSVCSFTIHDRAGFQLPKLQELLSDLEEYRWLHFSWPNWDLSCGSCGRNAPPRWMQGSWLCCSPSCDSGRDSYRPRGGTVEWMWT
jgi:hypothetical protein